uniref:Calcium uniporter protein n=1 Tax=Heterorhabditis bacteriophora TaxID=37862 RepID=A0A1I7WWJ9_HETBA
MGGYLSLSNRDIGISTEELFTKLEKTRIERELAIAQTMESRKQVYKLAEQRERLKWSACGGGITVVLSIVSAIHHKNIIHLLPVFPITTYLGYMTHYCYGDKRLVLHHNISLNVVIFYLEIL